MSSLDLMAATAFGVEAVTARELRALGYEAKGGLPGQVIFAGEVGAICRANLWLRSADRLLLRMGSFPAPDFDQLFDQTRELPWERWLPVDATFPVHARSQNSRLTSVPACQRTVKKAVVRRLQTVYRRQQLPETGPLTRIELLLRDDLASLYVDTTGPSLHKRGYRPWVGEAPLKETLAAVLVMLSFWRPGRPFLDPFCGTGTIPIEAAMIGRNLAPGLQRTFAAESWPTLPAAHWQQARQEALDVAQPQLEYPVLGSDIDRHAIGLAERHAHLAGVSGSVNFCQQAFEHLEPPASHGVLIANPPYGERLDDEQALQRLYDALPRILRRLETWSWYFLTSDRGFERRLRRRADRRRKLYNGRIACTYYQFHGPRPPAAAS